MLRKTTLAIIGLFLSGLASAGLYSPTPVRIPGDVTVPCEIKRWDIGVQGLYLQPSYSSDKGYELTANDLKPVKPKWGWAYRLEGSYHFLTGNDITMTFIHYDNKSLRGGYAGAIPFAFAYEPYYLKIDNRFDQVNLILGQHVDMSVWKKVRFYGGLQYAKIRVDTDNNFTVVPPALIPRSVSQVVEYHDSDFDGAGPIVGLNYGYNLVNGFSLTANLASSILYGSSRYLSGFVLAPTGLVVSAFHRSQKTVVPSLEMKLGLQYSHDWLTGTLNLQGGFQALNYFNVLETRKLIGPAVYASNTNFALYGPYFGAKWLGYV